MRRFLVGLIGDWLLVVWLLGFLFGSFFLVCGW